MSCRESPSSLNEFRFSPESPILVTQGLSFGNEVDPGEKIVIGANNLEVIKGVSLNGFLALDSNGHHHPIYRDGTTMMMDSQPFCELSPTESGFYLPLKDTFDYPKFENIIGIYAQPISGYSDSHVMFFSLARLQEDNHLSLVGSGMPSLVDFPQPHLSRTMRGISHLAELMYQERESVVIGNNTAGGSRTPKGSASLKLNPHISILTSEHSRHLGFNDIVRIRNNDGRDDGIGRLVAQTLYNEVSDILSGFWWDSEIEIVNEGLVIKLDHFRPQDLGRDDFLYGFLCPLYHTIHYHLKNIHSQAYRRQDGRASDLDDVISYVMSTGNSGNFSHQEYSQYFDLIEENYGDDPVISRAKELGRRGELREGFGHSIGMIINRQANNSQAIIGLQLCFRQGNAGVMESLGVKLERKRQQPDYSQNLARTREMQQYFQQFLESASLLAA